MRKDWQHLALGVDGRAPSCLTIDINEELLLSTQRVAFKSLKLMPYLGASAFRLGGCAPTKYAYKEVGMRV